MPMTGLKSDIMKPGLKALYYSGAHRWLAPLSQGIGLIFMLHRVIPGEPPAFAPNRGLTVTPDYLNDVLVDVKDAGLDIVSLDEAHARLKSGKRSQRFACFTLDDGYRDNLEHAYPVFKRHKAPFTVYIPSDYPDGRGELWWVALEEVIRKEAEIKIDLGDGSESILTATNSQKSDAFQRIYGVLRKYDEDKQRRFIRKLCNASGVNQKALCRSLIMGWDEVKKLSSDPLVTIGAHTVAHYALAKLPEDRAREEMRRGADILRQKLGRWPRHLSYPYGDAASAGSREFRIARELGFKTAVTTRKGVLFPEHAEHLTALPRVSLNGEYQAPLYTKLFMSGVPFAIWNGFRRVDAA